MFDKDIKELKDATKHVSAHWDTSIRNLKFLPAQIQVLLDKLRVDWEEFKSDFVNFENIRVNRYIFEHIFKRFEKAIEIELLVISDDPRRMT